jgi:hypothetical protein
MKRRKKMNKLVVLMRTATLGCLILSFWGCGSVPVAQRSVPSKANPTANFDFAQEEAAPAPMEPAAPMSQKGAVAESVPQKPAKRLVDKKTLIWRCG